MLLCTHGKDPKKCSKCENKAAKADKKAQKQTDKRAAKRDKRYAKQDNKKINQIKNAAKDMDSTHDSQGRSRAGIRYRDDGSRIYHGDKDW